MKINRFLVLGLVALAVSTAVVEGTMPDGNLGDVTILRLTVDAVPPDPVHGYEQMPYGESFHENDVLIENQASPPVWMHLRSTPTEIA